MIIKTYRCNHPVYDTCTLYFHKEKGLAVIQQRFNRKLKATFWTAIDRELAKEIADHEKFQAYFEEKANYPKDGLYFTVTIRQVMWALKMKPLSKQPWETRW